MNYSLTLAPLILRLFAFVLDCVICGIFLIAVDRINPWNNVFSKVTNIIALWIYFALLESKHFNGTLGKFIVGIRVVDCLKREISILRATVRTILKLVSICSLVGLGLAGLTKKRQCLHDLVAGTMVVVV